MRWLRLRLIPTTLFALIGLTCLLGGIAVLVICVVSSLSAMTTNSELASRYAAQIPGLILTVAAGWVWLRSATAWWQRSWRRATLTSVAGFAVFVIGECLIHP